MDYVYKFPVVKGIQASKDYYIAMVPLKMLIKLFGTDEEYVLPEYRAQRRINESRIPVISKYILENKDSYVFSALAASIDGEYQFVPTEENSSLGILEVSMDAKFLINDGQHRKTAIIDALREDRSLENETISIVFYEDQGLERSQQIFTDLNKNAVKTSNSISELYDSRDVLAVVTRRIIKNNKFLNKYTNKEKDNLGKYSLSLFTLNVFYKANKLIIGKRDPLESEKFLTEYWNVITEYMQQWSELEQKEITKKDLRENYICTQNVVIQAFGKLGSYFLENNLNIKKSLRKIKKIDWSRNNDDWYMRAINKKGRIITNIKASNLISNYIKLYIGIELNEDEIKLEEQLVLDKETKRKK